MLESIVRRSRDSVVRAETARALLLGPWCWPPENEAAALDYARTMTSADVPSARSGVAVGVSVGESSVSLWVLRSGTHDQSDAFVRHGAVLGREARRAWQCAALAVPRSLPVLWRTVKGATDCLPQAIRLASWSNSGIAADDRTIDGPSFGLSFVLLLASTVFDLPLPSDVIASAAVDENGRVDGIKGLDKKIEAIASLAPRVRRLLVATCQVDEATRIVDEMAVDPRVNPPAICPVRSAAEALEVVYGDALEHALVEAGREPDLRQEIATSFLRLVMAGRGAAIDWTPVERAADLALSQWPAMEDGERFALEFARAVAGRHEGNRGTFRLPNESWLESQPMPIRISLVTHLVQQAADTGTPSPDAAEALALTLLPARLRDGFREQLKLAGARARLLAVTGGPDLALTLDEELAELFTASFGYQDVSFPLSEWFRLAGACGNAESFFRAENLRARIAVTGGLEAAGQSYVDLARCKALVSLERVDDDAVSTLKRLAASREVPPHVRWSAFRWLTKGLQTMTAMSGRSPNQKLEEIGVPSEREADAAEVAASLIALDSAVALGNPVQLNSAVQRLRAAQPGIVGNLERAASRSEMGSYIARFYPY